MVEIFGRESLMVKSELQRPLSSRSRAGTLSFDCRRLHHLKFRLVRLPRDDAFERGRLTSRNFVAG